MQKVYEHLNQYITHAAVIGMGSGSTIEGYIPAAANYIQDAGIDVTFVPTSTRTEKLLKAHHLTTALDINEIDLTIDGADFFNSSLEVVKGLGGALLREKQIGYFSKEIIIVAKEDKTVDSFENLTIPVEVNTFLSGLTKDRIREVTDAVMTDRMAGDALFITDNGNYIVDCKFSSIEDIGALHNHLVNIPGVVETGIFNHYISKIVSFNDADFTVHER